MNDLEKVLLGKQKPRIGYEQGFYDGFVEAMKVTRETILALTKKGLDNVS